MSKTEEVVLLFSHLFNALRATAEDPFTKDEVEAMKSINEKILNGSKTIPQTTS